MTRGGRNGGHQKGLYSWLESTSTVLPEGTAEQGMAAECLWTQPLVDSLQLLQRTRKGVDSFAVSTAQSSDGG